ncbi:hypothetical protein B0T17DRAFT_323612 [Bombardia bombarda]|uniref:DUF7707 domain-containing protein n=1 Tax=Bombardia bombarda TaxID=252184 RepID=A0AA39WMF3_9PEZI|nr:hypothetical protein B0T17DRAFT_323612 [Bombardia bombarda]
MRQNVLLTALSALTLVAAQNNFTINPTEVDLPTRSQWCNAEFNTCDILCAHDAATNDCDEITLKFACACASNNSAPGLEYYTQTIPTFVCLQAYSDCIAANPTSAQAQRNCASTIKDKCGALDPAKADASTSSSSSSSASAPTGTTSQGSSPTQAATTSTSAAAAAPTHAAAYLGNGLAAVAAGVFAAALL